MASLEVYNSLASKAPFFIQHAITNKTELRHWINKYKSVTNKRKFIFRGCNEAKYKLYSSGQRAWFNYEISNLGKSYEEFIISEIRNAVSWQNELLRRFYNAFGHPPYEISVLSFLQHYGAPTPLLDWTYSFNSALFFGTDKLKEPNSNNDIENYFSIYIIDLRDQDVELIDLLALWQNELSRLDEILKKYKKLKYNSDEVVSLMRAFSYQIIGRLGILYIPGWSPTGMSFTLKSRPGFSIIYNQHNLNVINQKGLFLLNPSSNEPLENYFHGLPNPTENVHQYLKKIICLNIHKNLKESVLSYLNRRPIPINKEFIYPQEEDIANKSFRSYLQNP